MAKDFITSLRPAFAMTAGFAVLLGVAYPLAITGVAQAMFPHEANGSLVTDKAGKAIGSELIGQNFASDRYFHPRPSAAGKGYDGTASSGSNYGPTSQPLADRVKGDVAKLAAEEPGRAIPNDLATASGSGLDPDISPEAAFFQADRVAKARGLGVDVVRQLVERSIDTPTLSFLGDPHVNVLALNQQLDTLGGHPAK